MANAVADSTKHGEQKPHLGAGFPRGRFQLGSFTPDPTATPFAGFQWRNTTQLTTNWIRLQLYTPNGARMQRDHLVAATEHIGALAEARNADADADGIDDSMDNCPYAVQNQADADGNRRGDECECADQDGNGRDTVSDIVAIARAIFDPELATRAVRREQRRAVQRQRRRCSQR